MKKIILFILLFIPIAVFSQTHKYYCEVTGTEKALVNGMKVIFDFGSNPTYNLWGDLNNKLKFVDDKGKEINFNTMVDAANYMEDKGWKFLQAYSSIRGGAEIEHWIFCKEADSKEKAKEGIMTKDDWDKLHNQ